MTALHAAETAQITGIGRARGDLVACRQRIEKGGIASREEADALIIFDRSLDETTPEWRAFFSRELTTFVLERHSQPGVLDASTAGWVMGALCTYGCMTPAAFAAALRILEAAPETPPEFCAMMIDQMCRSVIAGEGPGLAAGPHYSRQIEHEDVVLLHRILVAAGGDSGRAVSRVEAEALFDLHDAVASGGTHVAFEDLFFKAIASHLIAGNGPAALSRADMLTPDPGLILRRGVVGMVDDPGFRLPGGLPRTIAIGADDSAWLLSRVMRDGRPTVVEYALLNLFAQPADPEAMVRRRFLNDAA